MDSAHKPARKQGEATLSFTWDKESGLLINLEGVLTMGSVVTIWDKAISLQEKYSPKILTIDVKKINYTDSAGAALVLELKNKQLNAGKKFAIKNPSAYLQQLLTLLEPKKPATAIPSQETQELPNNFIASFGKLVVDAIENVKENIEFFGRLIVYFARYILHPHKIRYQDFWRAMEDIGPNALPIVFLIGFLVGVIITFQSAEPFSRFGAQIYIVDLVGLGLVREMGPLMTAILLAGRTASAFAAEIGSMKINQEIDALSTMGIDAIRFLAVPRILAAVIMTPLLSMFLIVSGLLGCFLIMLTLHFNFHLIAKELYDIVSLQDFFAGLIKTFVFGAIIASVGCLHGIKTTIGASAVGLSTTRAVVTSLIILTVVDGVFAVVYYALKV